MKPYIVILDRVEIPGELRIPDFDHVWVEHPRTLPGECVDHLWRASIGVTHHTAVSRTDIDACPKLALLIVTGPDAAVVDQEACRERGIRLLHLPPAERAPQKQADALMDAIEFFVRNPAAA
jgi:glycerate dehydrogenase